MYACMSSAAHIVLDFTNSYGIRPFEPFSHKWYSWDIVFVVEPIIFAVLLIGLLLPSLLSLAYPSENFYIRAVRYRKIAAISALTFIPLLCGLRHIQHQRAVATLRLTLIDGAAPLRVSASPYWLNVFRWQGVLETLDSYQIVSGQQSCTRRWTRQLYGQRRSPFWVVYIWTGHNFHLSKLKNDRDTRKGSPCGSTKCDSITPKCARRC